MIGDFKGIKWYIENNNQEFIDELLNENNNIIFDEGEGWFHNFLKEEINKIIYKEMGLILSNRKWYSKAEWREEQINSILED